jgi:hypothetical protein
MELLKACVNTLLIVVPAWSYFSGSIHFTPSKNSHGHWRCWQVAAVMVLLAEFINQD